MATQLAATITPITLTIQPAPANTLTVTAKGVDPQYFIHVFLQENTDLTTTNWVLAQTAFNTFTGTVVFAQVPITNTNTFFRVKVAAGE